MYASDVFCERFTSRPQDPEGSAGAGPKATQSFADVPPRQTCIAPVCDQLKPQTILLIKQPSVEGAARTHLSGSLSYEKKAARKLCASGRQLTAHVWEDGKLSGNRDHFIVGMTKLESVTGSPSGQRAVTVLTLVQNFTPSMPCWLVSPKALRFQPPKVW